MPRSRISKRNMRLSVTLDEAEYGELTRIGAALDLSAAWMIRRAVSEFIARNGEDVEPALPLRRPETRARKIGGTRGQ